MSMVPFGQKEERNYRQLVFHPQVAAEYNIPSQLLGQFAGQFGVRPVYADFPCGACGKHTNGRVLCDVTRYDGSTVSWCLCACEEQEPTILIRDSTGQIDTQLPAERRFQSDPTWPESIRRLFDEAAKSFGAGAFTSASMICRKILMVCACHEQELAKEKVREGEAFAYYVGYLADNVLTQASAKNAIDAIRQIGNDANHEVKFVDRKESERSLIIVHRMLNAIYGLRSIGSDGVE